MVCSLISLGRFFLEYLTGHRYLDGSFLKKLRAETGRILRSDAADEWSEIAGGSDFIGMFFAISGPWYPSEASTQEVIWSFMLKPTLKRRTFKRGKPNFFSHPSS